MMDTLCIELVNVSCLCPLEAGNDILSHCFDLFWALQCHMVGEFFWLCAVRI